MPTSARIVGGPGSGKTTKLLEVIEKVTARLGIDPIQIGFVSFTRAARMHAASEAGKKFGIQPSILEKEGWFRTLHSVCYRQMGIAKGELITGDEEGTQWLRKAVNDASVSVQAPSDNDDAMILPSDSSISGKALAIWDACRNRLLPLREMWEKINFSDPRAPRLEDCESTITLYEQAKERDGRLDFCDLLMRFAGKRFVNHSTAFADEEPCGEVPVLPVWIHDEMQDCSFLTSLVFARIIQPSTWVYLAGDRNQEIYSWAGANGDIFANWPCEKEEFLPVSHRCDRNILDVGKKVIQDPRLKDFHPTRDGGEVIRELLEIALAKIKPSDKTLILARTNNYASRAAAFLDQAGIPWKPTKGNSSWTAPAKAAGIEAIITLKKGGGINGEQVYRMMKLFPVKKDGSTFFEHGAKSHYEEKETREKSHTVVPLALKDLAEAGCTESFKEIISSGKYVHLLDKAAAKMAVAAQQHGMAVVNNPSIRIGTCHSAKGMEDDHVILLNQIPFPTQQSIHTKQGLEEERRVWYVSATRARHKLTIAESGGGEKFPEL